MEYRNAEGGRKALAVVTNMTASFGNKLLNFSFNEIRVMYQNMPLIHQRHSLYLFIIDPEITVFFHNVT